MVSKLLLLSFFLGLSIYTGLAAEVADSGACYGVLPMVEDSLGRRGTIPAGEEAGAQAKEAEAQRRNEILKQAGDLLGEDFIGKSKERIGELFLAYLKETEAMWKSREPEEIAEARRRGGRLAEARTFLSSIDIMIQD